MAGKAVILSSDAKNILEKFGLNIKKARLRRNIKLQQLAEQAGISEDTLSAIEKGMSSVSIGAYVAVLDSLGIETDLELLATDEEQKRKYRETNFKARERATKDLKKTRERSQLNDIHNRRLS